MDGDLSDQSGARSWRVYHGAVRGSRDHGLEVLMRLMHVSIIWYQTT